MDIKEVLAQGKARATNMSGSRKYTKPLLGVVIVLLLGALGMETGNMDFDLGKLMETKSFESSKVARDLEGNVLDTPEKISAAIASCTKNELNCADFTTQSDAQAALQRCGGTKSDVNGIDKDKDGFACEALPKGGQVMPKK
jgi:hypothetical protein